MKTVITLLCFLLVSINAYSQSALLGSLRPSSLVVTNAWTNSPEAMHWTWTKTSTEVTLTSYDNSNTDVVIPLMLDGLPVTGVGTIFAGNDSITSVSGGDNIKTLISGAFLSCGSLTSLDLVGVKTIGSSSLSPSSITYVNLPSLVSIGDSGFAGCDVANLYLPSVKTLSPNAFLNSPNITSVDLPSIESVGSSAFNGCTSLATAKLHSAKSIGTLAFKSCPSLDAVYFDGDAPIISGDPYNGAPNVTNYVTNPTATGWGSTLGGRPVVRMTVYGGSGVTPEQIGAISNNGVIINGVPLANGTNLTLAGGAHGGVVPINILTNDPSATWKIYGTQTVVTANNWAVIDATQPLRLVSWDGMSEEVNGKILRTSTSSLFIDFDARSLCGQFDGVPYITMTDRLRIYDEYGDLALSGNASSSGLLFLKPIRLGGVELSTFAGINDAISHTGRVDNPHAVTAAHVGAVPTNRTLTLNGQAWTMDSNGVFNVTGGGGGGDSSNALRLIQSDTNAYITVSQSNGLLTVVSGAYSVTTNLVITSQTPAYAEGTKWNLTNGTVLLPASGGRWGVGQGNLYADAIHFEFGKYGCSQNLGDDNFRGWSTYSASPAGTYTFDSDFGNTDPGNSYDVAFQILTNNTFTTNVYTLATREWTTNQIAGITAAQVGAGLSNGGVTVVAGTNILLNGGTAPLLLTNGLVLALSVTNYVAPGPGCKNLGTSRNLTLDGMTVAYAGRPDGVYTINVSRAASAGYCYVLTTYSTNSYVLGSGLVPFGTHTIGATNRFGFSPDTNNTYQVQQMRIQ